LRIAIAALEVFALVQLDIDSIPRCPDYYSLRRLFPEVLRNIQQLPVPLLCHSEDCICRTGFRYSSESVIGSAEGVLWHVRGRYCLACSMRGETRCFVVRFACRRMSRERCFSYRSHFELAG
jgi:hypothetical protein